MGKLLEVVSEYQTIKSNVRIQNLTKYLSLQASIYSILQQKINNASGKTDKILESGTLKTMIIGSKLGSTGNIKSW